MKVLVIIGDCIQTNSSANLCHIAYLNGLVELGCEVSLLSCSSDGYTVDESIVIPEGIRRFEVNSMSLYQRLSIKKKNNNSVAINTTEQKSKTSSSKRLTSYIKKKIIYILYGVYNIYFPFVRKSRRFSSEEQFDYVLSISSPEASHLATHKLLNKKKIFANNWIQIWEDPWYGDAYGRSNTKKDYLEEKRLLHYAERICYVSPLTLKSRQELYPESASKMYWQPLPYYYKNASKEQAKSSSNQYGYFGDYVPASRDLEPFYKAAVKSNISVNICGSPNNLFPSLDKIHIYPRLPLDELRPIEDTTNVLVFLCNRHGGQIPGKIYQYSATNKTILFILDGTDEEKKVLKEFFGKFNRYVFCENTVQDISRAIKDIENGNIGNVVNNPIEAFSPKETVRKILAGENG